MAFLDLFRRLIGTDPLSRAAALASRDQTREAIALVGDARPDDSTAALIELTRRLHRRSQLAPARQVAEHVLNRSPDDRTAQAVLAEIAAEMGDVETAITHQRAVVPHPPTTS